jgi:hypothetical protein
MNKRFCILQVTPSEPNETHRQLFSSDSSDFYFVTHDKKHPDALKFCPNTVWSETRNTLVELVPKEYDYYGFVDHDYILKPSGDKNPQEQILSDLEWNPAVLTYYPGKSLHSPYAHDEEYFKSRDKSCIPFTHAGLKIVHKSLLNWFFPLYTKHRVDIDACHMFNIQEIPFLRYVICSHGMVYDNGVSGAGVYNKNGALAKQKMDEMWREISPFYKKLSVIERARYETRDSLAIKRFYVDLFKNKSVTNLKNTPDVDYFDVEKISKFFDASSEWISNHLRGHK